MYINYNIEGTLVGIRKTKKNKTILDIYNGHQLYSVFTKYGNDYSGRVGDVVKIPVTLIVDKPFFVEYRE